MFAARLRKSPSVDPGDPPFLQSSIRCLHAVSKACRPGLDRLADHRRELSRDFAVLNRVVN